MTLEILSHDALASFRHGFFTRRGGASSGVFKGLNCGFGSSDQREVVQINRDRVAQALGVEPMALCSAHQVHSATALAIDAPLADPAPQVDALVTATPGIALAVLTADCQPVLFADEKSGVIGAAHAGWKGALGGVLEATLEAMEVLGAERAETTAIIGPSISQRAYEVGPEFLDTFQVEDPDSLRYFANGTSDRYLFDLPGYGLSRLRNAGVGLAEWLGQCTYSDRDRYFSYRRACHEGVPDYGRLISAIRL